MSETEATIESARSVEQSDAEVRRIEAALLGGDQSVRPGDLVDAEDERGRARRALQAARRIVTERAERAAEAKRLERIQELDRLVTEQFGVHEGDVIAAYDEAVTAIEKLCGAIGDHNAGLHDIASELLSLQPLPAHLSPTEGRLRIEDLDLTISPISADTLIAEAAVRAAGSTGQSVPGIGRTATLSRDRDSALHYGLEQNADGTWPATGPSDRLRRSARIVAGRDS